VERVVSQGGRGFDVVDVVVVVSATVFTYYMTHKTQLQNLLIFWKTLDTSEEPLKT
jgi:hypothetical protein